MTTVVSQHTPLMALGRGSSAVCIPVTDPRPLLHRCLRSVLAHTPAQIPVFVVEDGDGDPSIERFLSELEREIHHVRLSEKLGSVGVANKAFAVSSEADVVLLASHALVFEGWIERMSEAGRSDTTVATASALGNHAGLLSPAGPDQPLPADLDLERVAAGVGQGPRTRPRVPTADGHCIWIARSALELAGQLDESFDSLRSALVDFSQRCVARGLVNVAADDVFVPSAHPALVAAGALPTAGTDGALLDRRYPYLRSAVDEAVWPGLSRSLSVARRSLRTLSVTIDARIVRGSFSGAHAETLELIEALSRTGNVKVRAVLDPAIGADALAALDRLPSVERVSADQIAGDIEQSDLVHRPYQATSVEDLELLARLGERLVITHLDLIAFHNPGYFGSFESWQQHRRVTRLALATADRVIFLSRHGAQDAIREELIEPGRIRVLAPALGSDRTQAPRRRPDDVPSEPFLVQIGNDFHHKNRLFAIKLLAELRERGWQGELVLAGADVGHGSSRDTEAAYLAARPEIAALVHELPAVDEGEKAWLFANAAAILYPSTYEGFGLVPFEAAQAGKVCFFAPQASLAEVLPADAAVLVPWDAHASAERALPLLTDDERRRRQVELVAAARTRLPDWESFGRALLEIYDETSLLPKREASLLAADARVREAELRRWVGLKETMLEVARPGRSRRLAERSMTAVAARRRLWRPFARLVLIVPAFARRARRRRL